MGWVLLVWGQGYFLESYACFILYKFGVYYYFFQSIFLILYICFGGLITFLVWGQGYFWKVMAPRFFM